MGSTVQLAGVTAYRSGWTEVQDRRAWNVASRRKRTEELDSATFDDELAVLAPERPSRSAASAFLTVGVLGLGSLFVGIREGVLGIFPLVGMPLLRHHPRRPLMSNESERTDRDEAEEVRATATKSAS
jgi:hypothetical protein